MLIKNEEILKVKLKTEVGGPYLIYGIDSHLKMFASGLIVKKAVSGEFKDFNFHEFNGKDADLDSIWEAVETLPVFSEKNCVLVRDLPYNKLKKDEQEKLAAIVRGVPKSCVFILLMDYFEVDLKTGIWISFIKLFEKHGTVIELNRKSKEALVDMVIGGAKKRKIPIDISTARYFVEAAGLDTRTLSKELDKVCAFVSGRAITRGDIDAVVTRSVDDRIFEMYKKVIACDMDSAYIILDMLISMKTSAQQIMGALIATFVDFYRVKTALNAGLGAYAVAEYYDYSGKKGFRLDRAAAESRGMTAEIISDCLKLLSEADRTIKSMYLDDKLAVEQVLAGLYSILITAGRRG